MAAFNNQIRYKYCWNFHKWTLRKRKKKFPCFVHVLSQQTQLFAGKVPYCQTLKLYWSVLDGNIRLLCISSLSPLFQSWQVPGVPCPGMRVRIAVGLGGRRALGPPRPSSDPRLSLPPSINNTAQKLLQVWAFLTSKLLRRYVALIPSCTKM